MSDYKKPGNSSHSSKSSIKNRAVVNKLKKEISPVFIISFFVLVIIIIGCLLFTLVKKPASPALKSNPLYLKEEKEQEKLKVQTFTDKPQTKSEKPNYPTKEEKKQKHSQSSKTTQTQTQTHTHTSTAQQSNNYINKFVSSPKEWQPINPGLREATNRLKNLVYGGKPQTLHELNILENTSYYSAYSEKKRNPLWVAYRLDYFKGQNKHSRPGKFITDFRTKARISPGGYSKTGYDRGHMCPNSAIAARYGKQGQIETFLMSNICPQKPELNRKVWERLERLEEGYANKFGGIWIITGPIFDQHVEILNQQVEIPDAFFKILIDEDKGKVRVLPFIVPQNVTGKEILNEFLTSVDEIEKQTGLDFFTPMDKEFQDKLESFVPPKTMWN